MTARTRVLGDHKRVKSRLVTPFNAMFGPTRDVSWINMMIPELLWIAQLHGTLGDRRAVEIVTAFSRDLRAISANHDRTIWAAAGKFAELPPTLLPVLLDEKGASYADELRAALAPLAAWYPAHPLNALFDGKPPVAEPLLLAQLKAIVSDLFDRSSRAATMVQATALWLAFDADRLKVAADLALAQFPRIEDYPETELSQRIAASIRASLNQMFGETDLMASRSDWPIAFWNRGLVLEPCEFDDG
jgi:hypothetical protein